MSDDDLIARIQHGDKGAAEELIRRYYTAILRYCRASCGSDEQAEDLTQETFLRLFKALPKYTGQQRFRSFLYTIADHLCIDESRKLRPYPLEDQCPLIHEHDEIQQAEDRDEVSVFLDALSPQQRKAVVLRYGDGLSFRQIGAVMGCSLRTAQSRVRCAIAIMRKVKNDER